MTFDLWGQRSRSQVKDCQISENRPFSRAKRYISYSFEWIETILHTMLKVTVRVKVNAKAFLASSPLSPTGLFVLFCFVLFVLPGYFVTFYCIDFHQTCTVGA